MNKIHINKPGKITAIGTFISVGSRMEPDNLKGISHLTEHMMFKGKTIKGNDLSYYIEKYGGNLNAFTSYNYVYYFMEVSSDYFKKCLPLYYSLINKLKFSNDEFKKEKDVVYREIDERKDDWGTYVVDYMFMNHLFLKGDGLHLSILGTKNSIKNLTKSDLHKWYNKYYKDDYMTEIIIGNIENYEKISPRPKLICNKKIRKLKPIEIITKEINVNQTYMAFGGCSEFPQDKYLNYYLLSLYLNSILNNMSGKLFNIIREKYGFVYHIGFQDVMFEDFLYKWRIETGFRKENMDVVYEIMIKILKDLKNIDNDDLDYACQKAIGQLDMSYNDPINMILDFSFIYDVENWKEYLFNYKKNLLNFKKHFRDYVSLINFDNILVSCVRPK